MYLHIYTHARLTDLKLYDVKISEVAFLKNK